MEKEDQKEEDEVMVRPINRRGAGATARSSKVTTTRNSEEKRDRKKE